MHQIVRRRGGLPGLAGLITATALAFGGSVLTAGAADAVTADSMDPVTFSFRAAPGQGFTVPSGVTRLRIDAVGGRGADAAGAGGAGGAVSATFAVTPGQELWVEVGGDAGSGDCNGTLTCGGAGAGAGGSGGAAGGGGATRVSLGGSSLVVAGGGGGGGGSDFCVAGGVGGSGGAADQVGAAGSDCGGSAGGGLGGAAGSNAAPGVGGAGGYACQGLYRGIDGNAGSETKGGNGASGNTSSGAGGGGYFGGGSGGTGGMCTPGFEPVSFGGGGGGGGGSNFAAAQASEVSIGTSDRGLGQNGVVTFTPLTATGIAPQFTSPSTATFTAGQSGSFTVSATGTPLPALAATGLPSGLTFTDNSDGTATLAGSPTLVGTSTVQVTAANGTAPDAQQALAVTVAPPAAPIKATGKPGTPVLSDDNGWDTGLRDSDYTITMNMWWGNNGSTYRLFESGNLIATRDLVDNSPAAQQVAVPVTGKADGTYVYTCELTNSFGTTSCGSHTVTVADAKPGTPVLSKIQTGAWGSGDYTVATNMWWGTNGDTYRLYENGVLIDTQTLTVHTPAAQQATTVLNGRPNGTYEYRAELSNEFGTTTTSGIYTVTVGQ